MNLTKEWGFKMEKRDWSDIIIDEVLQHLKNPLGIEQDFKDFIDDYELLKKDIKATLNEFLDENIKEVEIPTPLPYDDLD